LKQYYVRKQELAYLAHDDIVDCGKGVRTQEINICGRSTVVSYK